MTQRILAASVLALATSLYAHTAGAIPISDHSAYAYSQSFDSLSTSGTSNTWTNDSTILGWSLFGSAGTAVPTYRASFGSTANGAIYSFGADASSDRALGSIGSNSFAGFIAVAFTNNRGSSIDSVSITYDGEQWRNGGNTSAAAHTAVLEFGFGNEFADVTSWSAAGSSFNFTSPVTVSPPSPTNGAVDGNAAGRVSGLGGDLATTGWDSGQTLWLRWVENNDTGFDHALAIDNFSLSVAAVPEPETYTMLLAGLVAIATVTRRRA